MNYHIEFDLSLTENSYPGKFYALEGIDGSGKTTQVHKLADYFRSQGREVLVTKEPTNNPIGQLVHKVIKKEISIPPVSLEHLFAADRALHLEEEIIPALKKGSIVIADRTLWSAVAYGIANLSLGASEKERMLLLHNVFAFYGGYLIPDKTYIIDIPAHTAIERIHARGEKEEIYDKEEILARVQKEYAWLAEKFREVLVMIDGTKSMEEVFNEIKSSM